MIKGTLISQPAQRNVFLKDFKPFEDTWLVSDLRSKLSLQGEIFKWHPGLEDFSVLRAQDFWQSLLKRIDFKKVILNRMETRAFLVQFIELHGGSMKNAPISFVEKAIEELAPLYFQCEVADLAEFISEKYNSKPYWFPWALRIFKVLDEFENRNTVSQLWLTSYLLKLTATEPNLLKIWNRKLTIDLGSHLSFSESELFKILAVSNEILVLKPNLEDSANFELVLSPYQSLVGKYQTLELPANSNQCQGRIELVEAISPLAEVQKAVKVIHSHAAAGIEFCKIAIVAPQIESYWPFLSQILREEKIPVAKPSKSRLAGFSFGQLLISEAEILLEEWSYHRIENREFGVLSNDVQKIKFAKFKARLAHLLDRTDLKRSGLDLENSDSAEKWPRDKQISGEDFLALLLSRVEGTWTEDFLNFFKSWLQEVDRLTEQTLAFWKTHWVNKLYQAEVEVQPASAQGVSLMNLTELDSDQYDVRIFLGLSQSNLNQAQGRFLSAKEVRDLHRDLGVLIPSSEQFPLESDLQWSLQIPAKFTYLFFPRTTMNGAVDSPAAIWQELSVAQKIHFNEDSLPELTFEVLRKNMSSQFFQAMRSLRVHDYESICKFSLQAQDPKDWSLAPRSLKKISVSDLESFKACAFKAQASMMFPRLSEASIDTSLSSQDAGSLKHLLASRLAHLQQKQELIDQTQLRELLAKAFTDSKILFFDEGSQQLQFDEHLSWLQNLSHAFKDWPRWILQSSKTETEVSFSAEVSGVQFLCRADRVDKSESGEVFFTDYKSSTGSMLKPKSWLKKGNFQVLAYLYLRETNGFKSVGGSYYDFNKFKFGPGLFLDSETQAAEAEELGLDLISSEEKSQMLADFHDELTLAIEQLSQGNLQALPLHESHCQMCDWYSVCRSPKRETRRED